jgi:hypothetical protein
MSDDGRIPDEVEKAHAYLANLFCICAPQCEPFPDLMGLCTQIDNLIAGYRIRLREMPDPAKPDSGITVPRPEAAVVDFIDWCISGAVSEFGADQPALDATEQWLMDLRRACGMPAVPADDPS